MYREGDNSTTPLPNEQNIMIKKQTFMRQKIKSLVIHKLTLIIYIDSRMHPLVHSSSDLHKFNLVGSTKLSCASMTMR